MNFCNFLYSSVWLDIVRSYSSFKSRSLQTRPSLGMWIWRTLLWSWQVLWVDVHCIFFSSSRYLFRFSISSLSSLASSCCWAFEFSYVVILFCNSILMALRLERGKSIKSTAFECSLSSVVIHSCSCIISEIAIYLKLSVVESVVLLNCSSKVKLSFLSVAK